MAAGSIPCVTKLCPHLTVDFRTPGNFTARPKTSCLVALPGVLVLSFARTLPRSFARTLPEGSGTGFGRVQLGGASPQIEVCHTELCQVFARELCQVFARRFSSLTPMRAWVLNYVRRELWSGQVILAPTLPRMVSYHAWCRLVVLLGTANRPRRWKSELRGPGPGQAVRVT